VLSGRPKEGEAEMRRALELDPLSPIINANVGMSYYVARQYDAAIAHWQKVLEMHRNYRLLHVYMTTAYVGKGMYPEAVRMLGSRRCCDAWVCQRPLNRLPTGSPKSCHCRVHANCATGHLS